MDTTTTTGRASMLDGNDPATGPECGPVRVFRLETRQGKGQAR